MSNGTVIILGGCGLVGNAVTRILLGSGFPKFNVAVVDPRPDPNSIPGVEYVVGPQASAFDPSFMLSLVERVQPIAVVDCINIASVASSKRNRKHLKDDLPDEIKHLIELGEIADFVNCYMGNVVKPIASQGIAWVDVGTVATGGMGLNIPFTHNEATHDGYIAPGLFLKNQAASGHGGLLDLLGRTPGYLVGRVVPRAVIVGRGASELGPITVAHLGGVPQVASGQFVDLMNPRQITFLTNNEYTGVGNRFGENGQFGLEEAVAITAIGMMETVTAQAVAHSVMDAMFRLLANHGSYIQNDVHPDPTSFAERQRVIKEMKALCEEHQAVSIAFGNLGPYLTTALWELDVLRRLGYTPRSLAQGLKLDQFVSAHGTIANDLAVALPGLGIPVITDKLFCPARIGKAKKVSAEEINEQIRRVDCTGEERLWAVDLRTKRLEHWVQAAKALLEADPSKFARSHLPLSWDDVLRPGSFWAAYATITGHGRAPYSAGCRY